MATTPSTVPPTPQPSGASLSDILSAIQNLVQAAGTIAQNYLKVQGLTNAAALTVPTVVKGSAGRVARVSVTVAGSATGAIYDGASLTATTKPIYVIPNTVGIFECMLPVNFGILVSPSSGQTVTVSFS
jgi:hypothetical protein